MKRLWLTLVLALLGFGVWSLVLRIVRAVPSPQRVAIATMGRDLLSPVSSDFSKARYFLIVDTASLKVRAIPNPYAGRRRPVGLRTGELLLDDQVGVVLARGIRPAASNCLRARGIRVYTNNATTANEALQEYLSSQAGLQTARSPVASAAATPAGPLAQAALPLDDQTVALPELGLTLAPAPNGTALITGVTPGSRAALAGLQPGDVLIGLGGSAFAGPRDVAWRLRATPGQMATVTLLRNNVLLDTRI